MIYQGIPEEMMLSLADKETTKDAWEAIKTLCQGTDRVKKAKIQNLKSEFEALTMKEDDMIDDFHMKMNGIVTNIRALGEEMSESYIVKKLLRAVPAKFLQITSTMEQFADLETMTAEEVVASLKAHEERIKVKYESKESDETDNQATTPDRQTNGSGLNREDYDDSTEPKKVRNVRDIYEETDEVEANEELLLMGVDEPRNFKQAIENSNWKHAMNHEISSIEENQTWELTVLPPGQKIIGLKWVYKLKRDANGNVTKYKARLVAKGYVQEYGIDYDEVYAPVTRLETVRLLLALSAKKKWEVHHLDAKTAFLNEDIKEDVYVAQPEGYEKKGREHLVYKLKKALYGLRQAPRAWYEKLNTYLKELGFNRCSHEPAVYTRKEREDTLVIAVYVDDILVTGSKNSMIENFKNEMSTKFQMSDLGKLSYYLGIEVEQTDGCIILKQSGYARKVLEKAGMLECNATTYQMDPKMQITRDEMGEAVDVTMFKSMVGGLRYLVHTRPDIAYSVGIVSRYMERPTKMHLEALKRIMRYLKGTMQYGLVYYEDSGNNVLNGYSDSDLAGHLDDRKSTGGMVLYLNENVITWVSQKQRCVALSSCEAEFMAATAAACQAIWLRKVLSQITSEYIGPIMLYIDNRSTIDLAKNQMFHG